MMTIFRLILLTGLIVCAAATALTKKPMQAVIIYMAYSVIMSVVWIMLESPDLAITEAAVGAGITSLLLFVTLKKIHAIDAQQERETGAPVSARQEKSLINHEEGNGHGAHQA